MPELPEVETVRASLLPYLPGRVIERVQVHHPKVLVYPGTEEFIERLTGLRFEGLERTGKQLIFRLPPEVLLVHLGMTGQLTFRDPGRPDEPFSRHPVTGLQRTGQHAVDPHTHISLGFADGCAVHYRDVRKFGKWRLLRADDPRLPLELGRLGPDPLTQDWQEERFVQAVKRTQRPVKAALLDQSLVAGVGNIYADEALFLAGIRPEVRGARLSATRIRKLFRAIPEVLQKGLRNGGTSFSDYVNADGERGSNQEQLFAYGRYDQACLVCGSVMRRTTVAQRTSTWCPRCQK